MQFLTIVKLILSLLPLIIQTIGVLENAFPESGKGATKLGIIKDVLHDAVDVSPDVDNNHFATAWPIIERIIGTVVGARKA